MTRGRVDVVQPSSVRAGGMSEIVKTAEAAYRRGGLCIPRAWCPLVGVADEVQPAAVLPHMPLIEYPVAIPESPLVSQLLEPPLVPDADGLIEVPDRPGLGFTLNEKVVERYRVRPF
jgi:L-alanine-DL-glutamate epimerase-like enolase superfamily enzyme